MHKRTNMETTSLQRAVFIISVIEKMKTMIVMVVACWQLPWELLKHFSVDFPEKLCVATEAFHFALWSGNCDISTTMSYLHVVGTA